MTTSMESLIERNDGCDRPVGPGTLTYPCRLEPRHDGPCVAPENAASIRLRRQWEEEQQQKQQDEWKPPSTYIPQELVDRFREQGDIQIVQDLLRHFGVTASTEATRQAISSLQRTRHERAVQESPEVPQDEPRRTTLLEDITKVIHEGQEEPAVETARYVIEIVTARLREGM